MIPRPLLTYRQRQVMVLVANGYTDVRIGRELSIAPETVSGVLHLAFRNLGANGRPHAVGLALRYGEISPADIRLPVVAPVGTLKNAPRRNEAEHNDLR